MRWYLFFIFLWSAVGLFWLFIARESWEYDNDKKFAYFSICMTSGCGLLVVLNIVQLLKYVQLVK